MSASFDAGGLKHGLRLRYPLRDADGKLLLAQGAEITDRMMHVLQLRGITVKVQGSLKVTFAGNQGPDIPISNGYLTIGRGPDNDVQIDEQKVSAHHCRIIRRGRGLYLEDLRSRNGTYLNEVAVSVPAEIGDGDTIRVGAAVFQASVFAAVAAETGEGSEALRAWLLSENTSPRPRPSLMTATEPNIDLDAFG